MFSSVPGRKSRVLAAITALAVTVAVLFSASVCLAGVRWTPDGVAVCTATGIQKEVQITSDGSGGAIITWEDLRSGNNDIYAQRVLSDGTVDPDWPADGVAVCTAANAQQDPQITSDGSGGAIITWDDFRSGGNQDVYAQRVLAGGTVDPDWPADGRAICTLAREQQDPQITSDGSGGAVITWQDFRGANTDIYAQKVLSEGTVSWTPNGVAICTAAANQYDPHMTTDDSGGAVIAWQDLRSGVRRDIYAQRVLSGGTVDPAWPADGRAICTAANDQASPELTPDGASGAIITWTDERTGVDYDVYAQRVLAGGTVDPAWPADGRAICTATSDQWDVHLTTDGSGGAIITWEDLRPVPNRDIYAQRVLAGGTIDWQVNGVPVCAADNNQQNPCITMDGNGGAIIAWQDPRTAAVYDIYAQRVLPDGTMYPSWPADGLAICTADASQSYPQITSDGSGGAITAWEDLRSGNSDVYAQRISRDAPTAGGIAPSNGTDDGVVEITDLPGTGFFAPDYSAGPINPNVKLGMTGEADIDAANVNVASDTQITCDFDLDGAAPGTWDVYVENCDGQGDTLAGAFTVEQGEKPLGSPAWIVAEGSTGGGFDTFILIQNPNDTPADTAIAFATENGIQGGTFLTVPPQSRSTLRLSDYMPDEWSLSTLIASETPIVVERSMYWDRTANPEKYPYGPAPYEMKSGHANLGTPAPVDTNFQLDSSQAGVTSQYFPEGSTAGFDTWIVLFNPNENASQATLTLMDESGPVVAEDVTVGPLSRKSVHLNDILPDANQIATKVTSDDFLAAERSMYWDPDESSLAPWQMIGGHATSGSMSAAQNWFVAEGSTGGGFETYILLQNPQRAQAQVNLTFLDDTGVTGEAYTTMPPQSRATVKVSDYVADNFEVSTSVASTEAIVAERSMYWDKREANDASGMKDGNSCIGEMDTATAWMVSEGSTGGGFDTFVLISNTEDAQAEATITFMTEDGPQAPFEIQIPANSRYTLWVNELLPDEFQVSTLIRSTKELVVERSMYWDNREMSPDGNFPARPYECIGGHSANAFGAPEI